MAGTDIAAPGGSDCYTCQCGLLEARVFAKRDQLGYAPGCTRTYDHKKTGFYGSEFTQRLGRESI